MNIKNLITTITAILDSVRTVLIPITGVLLICTCARRPGFSSIITSAKIYADMYQNENDDVVKAFVYNVVDKIKRNIQEDGVCFVIIKPKELKFQLVSGNAGGQAILKGTNQNPIFAYAIIR